MNKMVYFLCLFIAIFEIISAGVLAYAIAASKVNSKRIIKAVLIGVAVHAIVSIVLSSVGIAVGIVIPLVVFPVVFCILGSQTVNKFNAVGFISLIAYLISLFILPVISNKYEASGKFQVAEGIANKFGKELTPTQFEILANSSDLAKYSDDIENYFGIMFIMLAGVILFAILLFDMILLRKNTAQMIMGSILSVFAAGMVYLDYRIFHSDSLLGRVAGVVLSKTGFSLSPFCLLIMLFAILPVITAYIYNKKEKERSGNGINAQ